VGGTLIIACAHPTLFRIEVVLPEESLMSLTPLYTRWGREIDRECPHKEYPRPQLQRNNWLCLNGPWLYAIRDDEMPENFDGEILVPFSPESLLSGVGRQLLPGQTLWYRREIEVLAIKPGKRLLLHFGAVDQRCEVFVNKRKVGRHEGGYWPFYFDITDMVHEGMNELTISVKDDTDTGLEAYGKQKLERGGIWYTGQSGIWQTVWAEIVPEQHIESIKITSLCDSSEVEFQIRYSLPDHPSTRIQIFAGENEISSGTFINENFRLPMPDFRYWSPDHPFLYTVKIYAGDDEVATYFGMRQFGIIKGEDGLPRIGLNGKPVFHDGLLDQGYWSDGMYTPPSDEAIIWEIEEVKRLGFNMLRKHIKIEPLRWYYHCDRLGMLVWQDFVNGGEPYHNMVTQYLPFIGIHISDHKNKRGFGRRNREGDIVFERDMKRTIDLLYNVTSLSVWVPFNEGWGQYDAVSITDMLRGLDNTRLVDHASGWHDQGGGDFRSYHIYYKKFRMRRDKINRIQALTEFGGFSCPTAGHMASGRLFGYRMYNDAETFSAAFKELYQKEVIPAIEKGLSAAIYTQVSDVEDEINGLFTYDREIRKLKEHPLKKESN
jgi:hypothetical protein